MAARPRSHLEVRARSSIHVSCVTPVNSLGLIGRNCLARRAVLEPAEAVVVDHTTRAFDAELQELARKIGEMGGLAEKQITDAVEALGKHDVALAREVISTDDRVDTLQREIEEKAIVTIARRQPMAVYLREIVGALR